MIYCKIPPRMAETTRTTRSASKRASAFRSTSKLLHDADASKLRNSSERPWTALNLTTTSQRARATSSNLPPGQRRLGIDSEAFPQPIWCRYNSRHLDVPLNLSRCL